jgi:redox-sensitive bicupin YhaK (pirin superfamily)
VIDVRRAAGRFTTSTEGITTRHSFSFGAHYDPANVALGVLVAHNDELLAPGHGYDLHPHTDLEIVTWVLEGTLVHRDSRGHAGAVQPGSVQRLSAGSGVLHAERNDDVNPVNPINTVNTLDGAWTRFVQMWLRPDEAGLEPSYAQQEVELCGLVPLVSGIADLDAAVRLHTSGAALHVARLAPGEPVRLPDAPRLHLFVARGSVLLEGAGLLEEGDAVRLAGDDSLGGPAVTGSGAAEVLVWQLP